MIKREAKAFKYIIFRTFKLKSVSIPISISCIFVIILISETKSVPKYRLTKRDVWFGLSNA